MYIPHNLKDNKVYAHDVNSLYPTSMSFFDIPVGSPVFFEQVDHNFDTSLYLPIYWGCVSLQAAKADNWKYSMTCRLVPLTCMALVWSTALYPSRVRRNYNPTRKQLLFSFLFFSFLTSLPVGQLAFLQASLR